MAQQTTPTIDTSNPKLWVISFDPSVNLGPSKTSGKNLGVVNLRTQAQDVTINLQAYRPNPDYAG